MPNLAGQKPEQLHAGGFLGEVAYINLETLCRMQMRVELNFQGTGAQVSYTIRRPYPFSLAVVNNIGSTIATLPSAPSGGVYLADTNYTLLHNAAVGTILTVELIPSITT